MPTYFRITIRFLRAMSHGRDDRGEPEWPPSPLRVFQSLVAASAALWSERTRLAYAVPALRWLERQPAPLIVAPVGESASKYRLYVPDNTGDLVVPAWARGETSKIGRRSEKDVRPIHLRDGDAIHYLWPIPDDPAEFENHKEILFAAARSITHLGWGVDMVAAEASMVSEADASGLAGERWGPSDDSSSIGLRVAVEGTLADLIKKHDAFLGRIGPDGDFRPVPPLSAFRVVGYRRATDPPKRSMAAFSLLKPDASGFRPFDPARQCMIVAAMVRHAASNPELTRSLGWPDEKIGSFVLGHGETPGESHTPVSGARLAYLPLPSIETRGPGRARVVASIRRVMITVFGGHAPEDLRQISRLLSGMELIGKDANDSAAILSRLPDSDSAIRPYLNPATTWATVTPMILPGYDDPRKHRKRLFPKSEEAPHVEVEEQRNLLSKLNRRIDHLIRKAIRQAGHSEELARFAEIEWRASGFWPGTELATNYTFPMKLRRFRRLHVRIVWHDAAGTPISIPGPICLGGGRFCGQGLFAATN